MKHLIAFILAMLFLSGCTTVVQQTSSPSSIYLQDHEIYLDHFSLDQNKIRLSVILRFNNPSEILETWSIYQILLHVDQKTYVLNEISIQNTEFPFHQWDGTLLPHENKKITVIGSVPASEGTYATAEVFLKCQDRILIIKTPETLVSPVY